MRLRLPPLVGYLLAGVAVGPFTPGFVADTGLARQLAEIGVILLMFGVGLHFSLARPPGRPRRSRVPGAIVQIVVATALGAAVAHLWGWSLGPGLVFGLSPVGREHGRAAARARGSRRCSTPATGKIAVGWLIVEDLVTVLVLVLLPRSPAALGGDGGPRRRRRARTSAGGDRHDAGQGRGVRRADARRRAAAPSRGCSSGSPAPDRASSSRSPCSRSRSASRSARRRSSASRSRSVRSSPAS